MRPARTSDVAFLRIDRSPPSRPRFAANGPRPRGIPSATELSERQMVAGIIREARLRAGLPQAEIAHLLGASQTALSSWERGDEPVPFARRAQLAGLCGFDLSLIAGLDAESIALTDDERSLLTVFRHLPATDRRALLELVRP
ncbi:helix-turn-helix domain-containing protein [Methylobacterium sp. OT2]|uniref:helix-turn-helix domain-containing protein n=1 Tax=Methylobacterium sp. OT2 TaxID=2813779 RepID=UPI00197C1A6A|nr:helix-turn-helix domain-containing protein [Methylobacterium sp. OT2]MBN4095604.1 helix-turn-helix domain-containing protein [Methylobacterium sp. OT2]